jgi:two-component system nitrogen regulation response regulator NtrX
MTPSKTIMNVDILASEVSQSDYYSFNALKDARDAFEKDFIMRKLEENGWNVSKTAEVLDIERSNLHRKIKAFDLKVS